MAILTKQQLEALNQSSFPNNSTEAITPQILRDYNTAVIDSLVDSNDTGSFVPTNITPLNQFTASQEALNDTFATTGSNTFSGDQTIQSSGTQNGIFYKTGSSEFFVGQRNNGNLVISSSANDRIIDINPQSGWVEHYSTTNFNSGVGLRGLTEARTFTQQAGYVARFEGEFSASLQNGYAWVGNGSGFSQQVPTSSFAGGGTIVGYATTGSNTFVGAQYITEGNPLYFNGVNPLQSAQLFPNQLDDKFDFNVTGLSGTKFDNNIYIDGEKRLFIKRSNTGADQYLRLGATDNSYNFAFIVTGSDTNPGQQVWGINTAGGTWANSFDAGVVFNSYVTASNGIRIQDGGTFSAPLQQGYVWVGDSNGRTTTVPTSSFGGGGGSTFPYTGNAQITGSLGVTGAGTIKGGLFVTGGNLVVQDNNITTNRNLTVGIDATIYGNVSASGVIGTDSRMYVYNQYGGIDIQQNAQGSGSQYPGMSMKVAPNVYPTDIFGGFTVLTEEGALAGSTFIGMVANSYTAQYGGTTVPMIIANGNNPDGSDTAIIWAPNGTAEHWKKSNFKYGADITGSLKVTGGITGSISATNGVISGSSQISGLGYALTGSSNTFTTRQRVNNPGGIALELSGSILQRNGNSVLNGNLTVSGAHLYVDGVGDNAIQVTNGGISSTGTITGDNGIVANNSNLTSYGGGLSIQANAQGSGSAYAIATATVDNTTDPTNVYSAFQLIEPGGNALIAIAANSYTGEYPGVTIPILFGGGNNPNSSNAGIAFPSNGQMDVWKKTNHKYEVTFTTGSNQQAGVATLNGSNPGTVTVSNSLVTANSIILLTKQSLSNTHSVAVTAKSAGSFTITSTGNGDTDQVGWFIINNS